MLKFTCGKKKKKKSPGIWGVTEMTCRPTISDDYIVYLQEHEYDVGDVSNPTTYKEAIVSPQV